MQKAISIWARQAFGCLLLVSAALAASAQAQVDTGVLPGPAPSFGRIAYASTPKDGEGHLLDLYLPAKTTAKVPLVIFTHGSGWMRDNGRSEAQALAAVLLPKGYAVAGVSIRSSAQTQFPGQLHDIKAAIRWLRTNAGKYGIDPDHIGIMGDSSGGWTSAMAAVTSDAPEMEGDVGVTGVSSAIQVAVAFYPPTDILNMDAWALSPCDPQVTPFGPGFCHLVSGSPETRFLGCIATTCLERAAMVSPLSYISRADPPIMIIHGENDAMVPHAQGERLYQALNKACHEAQFISLPLAYHGGWHKMMIDPELAYGATIRSTEAAGCKTNPPRPLAPSWDVIVGFIGKYLKPAD
jgi:acetyl esterase/lipase